jgi:hypothetical protein
MTTQTKPTLEEMRDLHARKVADRDTTQASRARFLLELESAQDEETRLRSLVKSGDVATRELSRPQLDAENLRTLIAEATRDISALDGEIITICAEIENASTLADMRAHAARANVAASDYHRALDRAAMALQSSLDEMRVPFSEWERARSDFRAIALREMDKRPLVAASGSASGMGAAHDSKIAHAENVLREVSADDTGTENVWGALPNDRSFSGADLPKSSVTVAAPLADKMAEIFREKGRASLT